MTDRAPCRACGKPARLSGPVRLIPFRNLPGLRIPDGLPIPICLDCWGAGRVELTDAERAALAAHHRKLLHRLTADAIETLARYSSLRQLERLLDVSQGYLSRLRHGAGDASATLVGQLALIAYDPRARLAELRDYWRAAGLLNLTHRTEEKPDHEPNRHPHIDPTEPIEFLDAGAPDPDRSEAAARPPEAHRAAADDDGSR